LVFETSSFCLCANLEPVEYSPELEVRPGLLGEGRTNAIRLADMEELLVDDPEKQSQ
jgi:hypothetical protein